MWKTKDGKLIPYSKLSTEHLKNILKWIEKKAEEGIKVEYFGYDGDEESYYDYEIVKGQRIKNKFNFDALKYEYESRIYNKDGIKMNVKIAHIINDMRDQIEEIKHSKRDLYSTNWFSKLGVLISADDAKTLIQEITKNLKEIKI